MKIKLIRVKVKDVNRGPHEAKYVNTIYSPLEKKFEEFKHHCFVAQKLAGDLEGKELSEETVSLLVTNIGNFVKAANRAFQGITSACNKIS